MNNRESIHARLDEVLDRQGDEAIIRWLEINRPNQAENFLTRLYEELRSIVDYLERTASDRQGDREDKITRCIVGLLRQTGYQVTHDEDQKGRTDLLVLSRNFRWLGEAKIHTNYEWLFHGLAQLQTYATGREEGYALLIYIFGQDARDVMEEWHNRLSQNECQLKSIKDGEEPLTFWSVHEHLGSGLDMNTKHIGVSLYYQSPGS